MPDETIQDKDPNSDDSGDKQRCNSDNEINDSGFRQRRELARRNRWKVNSDWHEKDAPLITCNAADLPIQARDIFTEEHDRANAYTSAFFKDPAQDEFSSTSSANNHQTGTSSRGRRVMERGGCTNTAHHQTVLKLKVIRGHVRIGSFEDAFQT
ncbi:hypothetical protein MRB53_002482 [Persea americana]|uniref:Uncharacterized protein n=1 Tax=Persea americana TaxID=3435 RepID=A0ACC2MUS8_PERAE|nr:hypothetical protein MRB53_002482 [Persea americana]